MKKYVALVFTRPVTFLLFILFRILSIIRPLPTISGASPVPPSSIVIFSTAGIGDTLSDTPAIRAVKETFPNAKVSVVVHQKRAALLLANPWIDRIIPHRKNIVLFFLTLKKIRKTCPDTAVILRANDPDIWPLAYLSGARVVVSRRESTVFPFLVNRPVSIPSWSDMPGVLQTLKIVESFGAKTQDARMDYVVTSGEREELKDMTKELGIAFQIHESPRLTFRDWPAESCITLCRLMLEEFPGRLFLTGGADDIKKSEEVERALINMGFKNRVANQAGKLSLRKTAALLEQCALFVTTDTGVMHMGFALNVPTLAILHPYNARRVGPHGYGDLHRTIVMEGPERDGQGELRPLSQVTPEAVFAVFKKMADEVA